MSQDVPHIPVDVLLLIFRWAMTSVGEYSNFSRVNKQWKNATRKRALWEALSRAAWPAYCNQLKANPDRDWCALFRNRRMAEKRVQASLDREFTSIPIEVRHGRALLFLT